MSKRPHLLYIAWAFPPCRAAGVYRALAAANTFSDAGWRVTVLTTTRSAFERYTGTDESLEQHIRPDISVQRIPFSWPAQETDIRAYSRLRVLAPPVWRRLRLWADRRVFPEAGYGPWRSALVRAALQAHRAEPVDLVMATANPHVTFEAAHALHHAHGVPYIMDYRDAWVLDVFSGARLHGRHSRQARAEQRMIRGAREIWFVNDPIRRWHMREYPEAAARMHVVANGWDPDLLGHSDAAPATPATTGPRRERSGHRFAYLGTVTPKVPLEELLSGWRRAVTTGAVVDGSGLTISGYLGYFAVPRTDLRDTLTRAADIGVEYTGPVPKSSVGQFYDDVDILVLALGTGRYVTSGKVFEYIATGKPIVSVHDPANAASDVLTGYPLWFPARSLDPEDISNALADAVQALEESDAALAAEARSFGARFRRDKQFLPRIDALRREVVS